MTEDKDWAAVPGAMVAATEILETPRIISAAEFLALWTPAEVQLCAVDPVLNYAMLGVITQGAVNLNSPRLPQLLALAMNKGLTQARAAQISAGTPPTSSAEV